MIGPRQKLSPEDYRLYRERRNKEQREYRARQPKKPKRDPKHVPAARERDRAKYLKNTEKAKADSRRIKLKTRYGVTPEWYDQKLDEQGGVCAICKLPPTRYRHGVDHNHVTGAARGILCSPCNTALGALENKQWRELAERYLKQYE